MNILKEKKKNKINKNKVVKTSGEIKQRSRAIPYSFTVQFFLEYCLFL